ncbi:phosphoglycerate kinase, cytosolic-like [Lycium ferocissimum]|uniref:phosphoglycerate kinase, cytosolic-like n=1 Tax=Lycium ferocissimum TaxID=112874 RepID=UPI0028158DCD|nr:phosphoglycerate kinase, cytosolic-like [Lycium ferocissimum]
MKPKPAVAGFLMHKEIQYLVGALANPNRPVAAIVGGSSLADKIRLIKSLLKKVDFLLLGGGIVFSFYKAMGYSVGSSLVEQSHLKMAEELMSKAKAKEKLVVLPSDVVIADRFGVNAERKVVQASEIPDRWMGLDIGPETMVSFGQKLETAKTIIWNGPVGVYEYPNFAAGTEAIAKKLAVLTEKGATTIVLGGDTIAAVKKVQLAGEITHISTGGIASVEILEGLKLRGTCNLHYYDFA